MHIKVEDAIAPKYDVLDMNTGMRIPGVQEANDETGELSMLMWDFDKNEYISTYNEQTQETNPVIYKFTGNIKLVKKEDN
jgi:hypothetical protein